MVEIVIKKLQIDAEYSKGQKIVRKVAGSMIQSKLSHSKGDFAEETNKMIDNLNELFTQVSVAMNLANEAIKNVGSEFDSVDKVIGATLEVVNKPKL